MYAFIQGRIGTKVYALRPRKNGRHFPEDILKWIFLNENAWLSIIISLKVVPKGPINTIPALVQIMAWRRIGDKPLSEPMSTYSPTHICVSRPWWVKCWNLFQCLHKNENENNPKVCTYLPIHPMVKVRDCYRLHVGSHRKIIQNFGVAERTLEPSYHCSNSSQIVLMYIWVTTTRIKLQTRKITRN